MKPIKFLFLLFLSTVFITACKPKSQAANKLNQTTKDFFEIRNGCEFIFTTASDTTVTIKYTSENYINNQVNEDIENNEIMTYDLKGTNLPSFTIRSEAGGSQYKDRIAILTNYRDTLTVGPIIFNLNGNFEPQPGTFDSVVRYPTYTLSNRNFNDVIRVRLGNNSKYKQMYFAKNIGIIGWQNKQDITYFVKAYTLK